MASAIILGIMLILTVVAWIKIPAGQMIATHSNLRGQPDAYSNKTVGLLGLPIATLILAGVFLLLAKIQNLSSVKTIMWVAALTPMVVLQVIGICNALGRKLNAITVIWGTLGLLLIVVGNYFPKLRRNRVSGIKTPWTLSSELSWNKTHRIGGPLVMLYGLMTLMSVVFCDPITLFKLIVAGGVLLALFLIVYSYIVWKSDPGRSPWLRI